MKTYIYILFLLATIVQPLLAQDAPATKAQPDFPTLPYTVTYNAAPAGGTVKLSVPGALDPVTIASGGKINSGVEVTLTITPDANYKVVFGYPKVYCTKVTARNLELIPVSGKPNEYNFTMPNEPVTVEVKFQPKPTTPSSDARLKALRYKIGDGQPEEWIPVPDFTPDTTEYDVTLSSSTTADATVTLSGTVADAGATLNENQATATLSNGSGSATLIVTAEDNATTVNYKVNFVKVEAGKSVVTINPPAEGGTITVTDASGKVINSGDVVDSGTELTLTNTPVAGYVFSKYMVGVSEHTGTTVTVGNDVTISAQFNAPSTPIQPETIGTPAVTEENPAVPTGDAAVVIVPDAGSLPEDTELSQLRLIKKDVDQSKEAKVKEDAKKAAETAGITVSDNNMILMEVTLVKVTTFFDGNINQYKTTVASVQPTDKVKVRIPYPANVNKNDHNITIIHLKSDGSTEVYSQAKGNLTLAADYMEITVTGFSPFVVTYVDKPSPNPVPVPVPNYYTVTLPDVEGVTLSKKAGNYTVEEGYSFSFALTLNEGYELYSEPVVKTNRGETIEPRASDGKYVIRNVEEDIVVTIEGIVRNDGKPTANAAIASGTRVWAADGWLYLSLDSPARVCIVDMSGRVCRLFDAPAGETQQALRPGVYLVRLGEKRGFKVAVR